ncbi:MAG: HAD-IB family phosphatase [Betaproteobacteria bacterium]
MLFAIDFDGTVATEDTVDALLEKHADPAWELLEAEWRAGKISALECMREQIALVRADHITLVNFFRSIRLDPHFRAFYEHVRHFAQVAVISDGLDFGARIALRQAGLERVPVFANRLEFMAPDRLVLSFPLRQENCGGGNGVCKCAVAQKLSSIGGGPIVLVGDGKSDACLAKMADIVFAKGELIRHCQENDIDHIPFQGFDEVLATVRRRESAWLYGHIGIAH